jgi:hypothetical protein
MPNITTVPHPNCPIRVWTPRTLCTSCTSCLELPVLYRFTSLHCMSPSSVQCVHPSVCAHAPFMPFLSKKAADLRSQHSLSVSHLTTSPWSLLHAIHLSTIDTTRSSWTRCRLFFLSLYCLDFRCPSGYPSHIHPPTPCRNIHMSFTCTPHTVHSIKPRSAFQKAPALYTERTSLHLLDPVPPICFVRFALSSLLLLFLGI